MKTKKTPGERIASDEYAMDAAEAGPLQIYLAERIDRAIRKAQAQAWDEGMQECASRAAQGVRWQRQPNPYRGRRK